jgi:hypothetical protein
MTPQTQEATTQTTQRDDMALFRDGIAQAESHPLAPKPAVQALRAAARLIEALQADVQALRDEVQACQRCRQPAAGVVQFPGIDPALIAPQNGQA